MDYKQKAQEIREARRALYEEAGRPSWHPIWMEDIIDQQYQKYLVQVWAGTWRDAVGPTNGILAQTEMSFAAAADYAAPAYCSEEFWKLLREVDDV